MNTELKVVKEEKYGFFNKVIYSISKPSKYEDMAKLGLKKACSYLMLMLAIIAIILAGFTTYNTQKIISTGTNYIKNNVPDIWFKNYELTSNEESILTNKEITDIFSYSIIIDTNISVDEAKEKYKDINSEYNIAVLLRNDFLIINSNTKEVLEFKYEDSLKNYGIENDKEYTNQDIISYFNSASPVAYMFQYFSLYLITYFFVFLVEVIVIAVLGIVIKLALKKQMTKHELAEYAIYSTTAPIVMFLVYLVINFFTNFTVKYLEFIILAISLIYMFIAIKSKKNDISKECDNGDKKINENESSDTVIEDKQ